LRAHPDGAVGLPEITLTLGAPCDDDALVEQSDCYEVAGRPAAYRLVSHRRPEGYVLTSEWRWGEVVLRGTARPDEHAGLAEVFEDVAETVTF
jgi:hypothetical protein